MSEHMHAPSDSEKMLSPQWKQNASSENEVQSGDHFESGAAAYHTPGAQSQLPSGSAQRTANALSIQRTRGNQAFIQRMGFGKTVQRQVSISSPDDAHEQEAESTADRVMAMGEPSVSRQGEPAIDRMSSDENEEEEVSRKVASDAVRRSAASNEQDAPLHRSADEQQLQSEGIGEDALPDPGPGRPLDPAVRSFMEPRFGASFEGVKIHTGSEAARSATAVNSVAYTRGDSIVFGEGQYAPDTSSGKRLIAHELTHAVQGGMARSLSRKPSLGENTQNADLEHPLGIQRSQTDALSRAGSKGEAAAKAVEVIYNFIKDNKAKTSLKTDKLKYPKDVSQINGERVTHSNAVMFWCDGVTANDRVNFQLQGDFGKDGDGKPAMGNVHYNWGDDSQVFGTKVDLAADGNEVATGTADDPWISFGVRGSFSSMGHGDCSFIATAYIDKKGSLWYENEKITSGKGRINQTLAGLKIELD